MGGYVFTCSRYPQLQVGRRSAGVRFHDGRFETSDEDVAAALRALPAEYGVTAESQREGAGGGGSGSGPGAGERPARSANKAAWLAYAVACGADEAEAESTTRADLIEAYGGED